MPIYRTVYGNPVIDPDAFILPTAVVSGDVRLAKGVNVWHHATIRGDMASVTIGEDTNVQDNAVIHVNHDRPTVIGKRVTIGHGAIVHGAIVEDDALIGMGSILLDGCCVERGAMVGAGTLVPPGKTVPAGMLAIGSPMRIVRPLTDAERLDNKQNIDRYLAMAAASMKEEPR